MAEWLPSQYGLFAEAPQRHSAVSTVLAIVCFCPFCRVSGPLASSGPFAIGTKTTGPDGPGSPRFSAGAKSPASDQPEVLWLPSQKGFLADAPHRQKDARGWFNGSAPAIS